MTSENAADETPLSADTRSVLGVVGLLLEHGVDSFDDLPADVQRQWRERAVELIREEDEPDG